MSKHEFKPKRLLIIIGILALLYSFYWLGHFDIFPFHTNQTIALLNQDQPFNIPITRSWVEYWMQGFAIFITLALVGALIALSIWMVKLSLIPWLFPERRILK